MSDLKRRLLEVLDYALADDSDELIIEVVVRGACMEEQERSDLTEEENPGGLFNEEELSDFSPLITLEFSTERRATNEMSRADLEELRDLLAGKKKGDC